MRKTGESIVGQGRSERFLTIAARGLAAVGLVASGFAISELTQPQPAIGNIQYPTYEESGAPIGDSPGVQMELYMLERYHWLPGHTHLQIEQMLQANRESSGNNDR